MEDIYHLATKAIEYFSGMGNSVPEEVNRAMIMLHNRLNHPLFIGEDISEQLDIIVREYSRMNVKRPGILRRLGNYLFQTSDEDILPSESDELRKKVKLALDSSRYFDL